VTTRTGARHLHLARTARVAGEAFAFVDPDAPPAARRLSVGGLAWLFLAVGFGVAAYLGL
jgi:hypothetical protein